MARGNRNGTPDRSRERELGGGRSLTPAALERELRKARVDELVGLMASGAWFEGLTHQQKAAEWGVPLDVAARMVLDATKIFGSIMRLGDADATRARLVAAAEDIRKRALDRTSLGEPAPDLKAAIASVATQGRLCGLEKLEVKLSAAAEDVASLPRRKQLAMLDERIERYTQLRAELVRQIAEAGE